MKILQFAYMSTNEEYDVKWSAWSRIYEYTFVIKMIKELYNNDKKQPLIHNTGCGGGEIHLDFAKELNNYGLVVNTDNDNWRWGKQPDNFIKYDLLNKCNFQSDITLCVSTLEHLNNQVLVLQNLIDATKEGGYIIVTLDSPPVNLVAIEEYLGVKCEIPEVKLNQRNSKLKNMAFIDEINIVKLVIQK